MLDCLLDEVEGFKMSFQEKGFWMGKSGGHLDAETLFGSSSTSESKRPHHWFVDAAEQELFPSKKQAVETPNSKFTSEIPTGSLPWDTGTGFHSSPNQFIDRLFGSETNKSVGFSEGYVSPIARENSNNQSPVSLSMTYGIEAPNSCLSYGGIRKVKVDEVKDLNSIVEQSFERSGTCSEQVYNRMNENSFITIGQAFDKDESISSLGQAYKGEADIRSIDLVFGKDDDNSMGPIDYSFDKVNNNTISFEVFSDVSDNMAKPINSFNLLPNPLSVETSDAPVEKALAAPNPYPLMNASQAGKQRIQVMAKTKSEPKQGRKEAPNSFPSNVRSLIATGMLDGVPVKYVALSREELRGIIKGSGYLCGCQSCNYSKALNAYEFERHAGCKTKHPNNHIYFENGKTIYQIVQELRSTPETLLFDAIQTVTGSPINQKAFRTWKESFQAATRELQRIYGKEELNI
ncbi:uncharacterized protein LOC108216025 [Daucus carota subsp. sativus]|nr:PREDICTED: uncharacterized protein LOC108216025 [Daucus carota subsp. sativus]